jgi:hypothetical protein
MAYICIQLQTDSEGDVSDELAAKIEAICPDIDLSSGWDFSEDEDKEGNATYSSVFGYGDDDYTDDEGNSYNHYSMQYSKAEYEQWIEMLKYYIAFYPLSKSDEIDFVWINDGSQFGYCPEIEYAQNELKSCEFSYRKEYIVGSITTQMWAFSTKTVRILHLPTGSKTVYF